MAEKHEAKIKDEEDYIILQKFRKEDIEEVHGCELTMEQWLKFKSEFEESNRINKLLDALYDIERDILERIGIVDFFTDGDIK